MDLSEVSISNTLQLNSNAIYVQNNVLFCFNPINFNLHDWGETRDTNIISVTIKLPIDEIKVKVCNTCHLSINLRSKI